MRLLPNHVLFAQRPQRTVEAIPIGMLACCRGLSEATPPVTNMPIRILKGCKLASYDGTSTRQRVPILHGGGRRIVSP
jgi:hypothetical protein